MRLNYKVISKGVEIKAKLFYKKEHCDCLEQIHSDNVMTPIVDILWRETYFKVGAQT